MVYLALQAPIVETAQAVAEGVSATRIGVGTRPSYLSRTPFVLKRQLSVGRLWVYLMASVSIFGLGILAALRAARLP
jgi:hypothetical protein